MTEKKSKRSCKKELDKLKKVVEEERERSKKYLEQLKYLQAEFENQIKRIEHQSEDKIKNGNAQLITSLLPVIDDLERAIEIGNDSSSNNPILEGIKMVLRNMLRIFKVEGLQEITTVGEKFDPSIHEAVNQVFTLKHKEGTILKELRKGYIFKKRVLRTSLVEVAKSGKKPSRKSYNNNLV
jgi:molecular chaperone GrpE